MKPITKWHGEIPIHSVYTAGTGGQLFFKALKESGDLVGTRCVPCNQVYVPARHFCERCFAELVTEVSVKPQGELKSFTIAYVDHDGEPLKLPLTLGLVQLEGATTLLVHRLLDINDASQVPIGSQVEVVIKPKAKRTGSILDIEGFRLIRHGASSREQGARQKQRAKGKERGAKGKEAASHRRKGVGSLF